MTFKLDDAATTIALIDDEPAILRGLTRTLERAGYRVRTFTNAAAALAADVDEAALVITDLHMPGIDGWQFARALHDLDPRRPVIVMSGDTSLEDACDLEPRAIRFLSKPFGNDRLKEVVAETLNDAKARRRGTTPEGLRPTG